MPGALNLPVSFSFYNAMPQRRANDAQVERLLHVLKTDPIYRSQLAHRIAKQDKIKYESAMRRLQRYITDAGQKRSFASAPKYYQREVRQDYREHKRREQEVRQRRDYEQRISERESRRDRERFSEAERRAEFGEYADYDVQNQDVLSVIAYHDGNVAETAYTLGLTRRGENQLQMLVTSYEADAAIDYRDTAQASEIQDAVRGFLSGLAEDDRLDVQAFHDMLLQGEMADWRIGVIVRDIESGRTTFAEWADAAMHDLEYPEDKSEFWELWREAYKRGKK